MSERFAGQWWLPSSPEHLAPGWLQVDPSGHTNLELIGSLEPPQPGNPFPMPHSDDRDGLFPLIHGAAGGQAFTLMSCFRSGAQINFTNGSSGQPPIHTFSETVRVGRSLQGAHLADHELDSFTSVHFQLSGLVQWMADSPVTHTVTGSNGVREHVLTVRVRPPEQVVAPNGAAITFVNTPRISTGSGDQTVMAQDYTVAIDHAPASPIEDLIDLAGDIQDLVTIGRGVSAAFSNLSLGHPGYVNQFGSDRQPARMKLRAEWTVARPEDEQRSSSREMYFSRSNLGTADSIASWLRVAQRHRHSLGRAMAARHTHTMFAADRLLSYCAALESYDQVDNPDPKNRRTSFAERLNNCIDVAGGPFTELTLEPQRWNSAVTKARHDVAHHRRGIDDGATLHYLAQSAYWLFVLCLLKEAQAPRTVFDSIASNSEFRWLNRQLRTVLNR